MGNTHWTDEEICYIKENYKTKTYQQLADDLGRSKSAVDLKINRLGLIKSKYEYNHDYFENINSEDKAYWLGFIYADGCVSKNEKINSCEISIKLQKSDMNHLKKFNKCINGNIEVSTFDRKSNFNNKIYSGCQIRIYSQKMFNDLYDCGIHPNKSLSIKFPTQLDENLIPHFIRGFFDGDGCLCESKKKKGLSSIRCDFTCGSIDFINILREILYKNGIKAYITQENETKPYRLIIGGLINCDKFLHYIYDNSTIYLDRKFNKKISLYKSLDLDQRLLRLSEKAG